MQETTQETTQETHQEALEAEKIMQKAVREELEKKAKLDQYAIINRDGKPYRIKAAELISSKKATDQI